MLLLLFWVRIVVREKKEKSRADILTVHCFFSLDHGLCLFAYSSPLLLFVDYS